MKFLAAAVQMVASDDKAANLKEAEHWVRAAAAQGARVVALPEVFIWRGEKKREREFAEEIPGPSSAALSGVARELGFFLLAGSILEAIHDSEKAYNTSLLFDPSGKIIASYRKIHLFDVDLANGTSLRESASREYGEAVVVTSTELCSMGLSVCYDLRFPEPIACWRVKAPIIPVPSARPIPGRRTGKLCCGRAPSKTRSTSSRRINSVRAPRVLKPTAIR
jgi:predicted amidohydrolase